MTLLQRYILGELLRVFASLLSVLTVLLVFVGVVGEASKSGLGPEQIFRVLPFIVPSLLPFTMPATLLLTVCVVYGRMAGDQEITALRAAGISVMSVVWPAVFLGGVLSAGTLVLTDQLIPWARGRIQKTVSAAMEDIFLDLLKNENQIVDSRHGFAITVMGVRGRTLIMPTFRYITPGGTVVTMQSEEADLAFDLEKQEVNLHLIRGHMDTGAASVWFEEENKPFPLPRDRKKILPRDLTIRDIEAELADVARERELFRQRQLMAAAIALTRGDFERFLQPDFRHYQAMIDVFTERYNRLTTEVHARYAMSCSCLFFVLLGTPFSIWQAKRQFLTSFAVCFVPILFVYYPLMMGCMNLSKNDGRFNPAWTMWIGNAVLLLLAGWVLRRVVRN